MGWSVEEGVRAYCASGEYGLLTKLTSPRGHSLAGNRGTGLPAVRACGEPRRARLGLPLVGVGGAGPCGGAVSPAHPGAGVGAVHRSPDSASTKSSRLGQNLPGVSPTTHP